MRHKHAIPATAEHVHGNAGVVCRSCSLARPLLTFGVQWLSGFKAASCRSTNALSFSISLDVLLPKFLLSASEKSSDGGWIHVQCGRQFFITQVLIAQQQ